MFSASYGLYRYAIGIEGYGNYSSKIKGCYQCSSGGCSGDITDFFDSIDYKLGYRFCWGACYDHILYQGKL
jgi:hypothetical protein